MGADHDCGAKLTRPRWSTFQCPGPASLARKLGAVPSPIARGWYWWRARLCFKHLRIVERSADWCPLDTHSIFSASELDMMADLRAAGLEYVEIADATGWLPDSISSALRAPAAYQTAPPYSIRRHLQRHQDGGHLPEKVYRKLLAQAKSR
jgi:hypothetical protein